MTCGESLLKASPTGTTGRRDGDHLLLGERLRAGQIQPLAHQLIGEQRAGTDPGQIPFVDQRFGESRVRTANDVTGADFGGAPGS
jgi:hypothetical protein